MEEMNQEIPRRRPVRRKKTKWQIFKEAYLPTVILAVTVILIIWFIIGGAVRRNSQETVPTDPPAPSTEATNLASRYQEQANDLLERAAAAAENYDYEDAVTILSSFEGNMADFPALQSTYEEYVTIVNEMVVWNDPGKIPTLSMHMLIADPELAYNDKQYGSSYKKNFITTDQFRDILDQLYANDCVLVDLLDVYEEMYDEGTGKIVYVPRELLLPAGKQPILLVETQVNYYAYMLNGAKDNLPDGFASKLCVDENGVFYNEMPLADGNIVTGAYDMVPILEQFIEDNPMFSYHGARAILAVSGYEGLFGYRVTSSLSAEDLAAEEEAAARLCAALQDAGYRIGCYTYSNIDYGKQGASAIQEDLQKWNDKILPMLGEYGCNILVYAREADIAGKDADYSGSKFNVMYNAGYRFFLGANSESYSQIGDQYVRHDRLCITGEYLTKYPERFEGLFDPFTLTVQ
jgi:hypothetical protein